MSNWIQGRFEYEAKNYYFNFHGNRKLHIVDRNAVQTVVCDRKAKKDLQTYTQNVLWIRALTDYDKVE